MKSWIPTWELALVIIGIFMITHALTAGADDTRNTAQSMGHGKIVAWFYPEMHKKATLITRTIDCEAGVVVYTANSHTYGFAVATSVVPVRDTLLLMKEVCDGADH
jgi:hypothetical protein